MAFNRITDRLPDGVAYVRSETGREGVGAITTQRRLPELISRLAEYEDTGLTPEQIYVLCDMDRRARMANLLRLEEYQALGSIDEIRELVRLNRKRMFE